MNGEPEPVTCPWCGSADVDRLSAFGPLHVSEQWMCQTCASPFERIRDR